MSRISKILSLLRVVRNDANVTDIKIDMGGGANITAEQFSPAGDDSYPLKTDYALSTNTTRTGGQAIIGFVDPVNKPKSTEGDKRIYARKPDDGTVVSEVWLKSDGTATILNVNGSVTLAPDGSIKGVNDNGSFELQTGGNFVVNGVTIDTAGNIDSPATIKAPNLDGTASVKAGGKELVGHTHPIAWTDPAGSGVSGPNN